MKKFIPILIFICSLSPCFANWHDTWVNAVQACHDKDYVKAESSFTEAIVEMESKSDEEHPHVYVDRARLYLLKDRHEEALEDLNRAIESPYLKGKDRLRAVMSRMVTRGRVGMEEGVLEDMKTFGALIEGDRPIMEITDSSIIIRNSPDCECYVDTIRGFLVHSGMVEKPEDFRKLSSGIIIAKRAKEKAPCCKECASTGKRCDATDDDGPIENAIDCHAWCARAGIWGMGFCGRHFKSAGCLFGCCVVVDQLVRTCNWCCDGPSGFYDRCIAPFDHIIEYMQFPCEGHDDEWD